MLAPRRSDDARIDPAERVAHVARDHVEPRGEEVAEALSVDLAEVAEAGAPLEEVSHARRGGLGLLAAREDRDPPDLRRALEQHADEHLADEAREARDEHVLAAQRRAHRERPGVGPVGLGARASFLQPSFDHRAIAPSSVSRRVGVSELRRRAARVGPGRAHDRPVQITRDPGELTIGLDRAGLPDEAEQHEIRPRGAVRAARLELDRVRGRELAHAPRIDLGGQDGLDQLAGRAQLRVELELVGDDEIEARSLLREHTRERIRDGRDGLRDQHGEQAVAPRALEQAHRLVRAPPARGPRGRSPPRAPRADRG
jgi:hypothetical protein